MSTLHQNVKEPAKGRSFWGRRLGVSCVLSLSLTALIEPAASAGKLERLAHTLTRDSSYKTRVRAAAALGKLHDERAVPALHQALKDDNKLVRRRARKVLRTIYAEPSSARAHADAGPGYHLTVLFDPKVKGDESQHMHVVREALLQELQTLPGVTVSEGGDAQPEALPQSNSFFIDGSIQLSSRYWAGGQQHIGCQLRTLVVTRPNQVIKMIATQEAGLTTGSAPAAEAAGKRECLVAAVGAAREDIQKYLQTVHSDR